MGWISVKESLPSPNERILLFGDDGVLSGVRYEYYEGLDWSCDPMGDYASGGSVYGITHWMPLPFPPSK